MQVLKPLLSALLLLSISASAFGWGNHGHRVIAELAQANLSPQTRKAMQTLLAGSSLPDASVWADQMRAKPDHAKFWGYDYSANWHFINIAAGHHYADSNKNPHGDAYSALLACTAILQNRDPAPGPVKDGLVLYLGKDLQTAAAKTLALKFVLHLIADLHQPLHLGYAEDHGGNDIAVLWSGKSSNLHALWDSKLFNGSVRQHVVRLMDTLERMDKNKRKVLEQSSVEAWIEEALPLRDRIYSDLPSQTKQESYKSTFLPLADKQLLRAGLRTAAYFNEVFDPGRAIPK